MNWLQLIGPLISAAIQLAEAIHPISGSGKQKLATAATLVQTGLGVAAAAGVVPPGVATDGEAITQAINDAVASANAQGGVPAAPPLQP